MKSRTRGFQDIDLFNGLCRISKSKTERAAAEIVLNPEAAIAFAGMFEIADPLGEAKPEHFVFCACENRNFDDPRPQKWCAPLGTRSPGKPGHEPAVSDERRPFRAVPQ